MSYGILKKISKTAYQKAVKKVQADERVWKRYNPNPKKARSLPAGAPRHATNRDRAVVEMYRLQNRKKAAPITGYVRGNKITNWNGLRICDAQKSGKKGVIAKCIDGHTYVGRSNGEGMWINLRPKK